MSAKRWLARVARGLRRDWALLLDRCPDTDRASAIHPSDRTDGDHCDAFAGFGTDPGAHVHNDCDTDGHYLCSVCSRMSPEETARRGLLPLEVPSC